MLYPLVTVLLCTYNDEKYVAEAIQSILNQSYKNFEFLIVNDGSTDGTKDIILSFKDERIRYLEHSENKGLEDSKNWGLEEAKGKYIAYIDGDDISEPDRLQLQLNYMEEHPETGICSTRKILFGLENRVLEHGEHDFEIRGYALFGTPMEHPSCMVRTEVLRKHHIKYRKDFYVAEDYPFMVDLLEKSKAYCVQIPLIRKRIHNQRISVLKKEIQNESAARASRMAFKVLLGVEAGEKERFAFKRCWTSKPELTDLAILENLKNKIIIEGELSSDDIEFRQYIKNRISKTISDLQTKLKTFPDRIEELRVKVEELGREVEKQKTLNVSTKNELEAMRQSLSWKITAPLRWLLKIFLKIFR